MNSTSKTARVVAVVVGFAMVVGTFGAFAAPVKAQSADIAALQALIASLQAQIAALTGGSTGSMMSGSAPVASLTMGSSGAEVTKLQNFLIGKGFSIPAGATGYFGAQTKAALSAFQAANGISPAAGYYGPITAASVASMMGPSMPSTPSNPSNPSVPSTGVEGSFTAEQAPTPANDANVTANVNVPVYGVRIKAQNADMRIDRADLEFAVTVNSTTVNPSTFFTNLSAWDGGTLVKSMPLSASDFTKDTNNNWYVRISGLNFMVPKDVEKNLVFSVNTAGISSADYARGVTVKGWSGTSQNIRGVDGLGLQSYANMSWTSTFTFNATNNAVLTASNNTAATPKAQTIAVDTTDGAKGVVMERFDLKATTGDAELTDLRVIVKTDSGANSAPTSLFLYDGNTLLGSESVSVSSGSANVDFDNMSVFIAKNSTKTLTVKADFPSTAAGVASTTIDDSASQTNTTMFETGDGSSKEVTVSSDIAGNDVHLYADSAAVWTLVSATAEGNPGGGYAGSASSSVTGTIVLDVLADGGTLTKPVASDFTMFFASSTQLTTNGGTGYTSATGISVTPSIVVTPNDATIGDGSHYTVTLTGTIYSNNTSLGSSQALFLAVNNIDWSITKTSGSNTVTNQNWGIDNFYTNPVQLTKSTQ